MTRYRAVLAYDGTAYRGFQRQAGDIPTIQGAVEAALHTVTDAAIPVTGAGRTDAGVHATGQVIAFDVDWRHPAGDLLRALNANLPVDIALQTIAPADPAFHPRFTARQRTYVYRFYQRAVRQPLWDHHAWHVRGGPLNTAAMQQAAALLIGVQDFATFGQPPEGPRPDRDPVTIRQVFQSQFTLYADEEPDRYTITANAFLQRMVRSIMGTLVAVGRGAITVDEFEAALLAADRSRAGPTAPACGLTLVAVTY
jgi:tRNA pseudouridine38-40 synthase